MPKADPTPTTSRRALLARMPAVAALAAAVPGCIPIPAPAAEPNPDAALIALCAEYVALDRELLRLGDEMADLYSDDPRHDPLMEASCALVPRLHALEAEIGECRAQTPEGLRALVQAARQSLSADADRGAIDLLEGTEVAWAVLDSVLAMLDGRALA